MALRDFFAGLLQRRPGGAAPAVRRRVDPRPFRRGFAGGQADRLVSDLLAATGLVSGQSELRQSLRAMRINSRRLANDNEYAKRFFQLLRNNVVGPRGFDLQMKATKGRPAAALDVDANNEVEAAFAEFSKRANFTPSGTMSRRAFERACLTHLARDGEIIVEVLLGRFNRFGIAYQLLDPDLLDETLNVGRGGTVPGYGRLEGVEIRMGVERDTYGKPVAYWFLTAHPFDDVQTAGGTRHRRVPAERIIHRFMAEEQRAGTTRGVPWLFVAMRRLSMLGGYEEAALVNARVGASKMGFYKQPESGIGRPGAGASGEGDELADAEDAGGNLTKEMQPGLMEILPPGWEYQEHNPTYPSDAMDGFVKSMLRAFAAGVGLNYNVLASDLEGVNYSSLRQGALDDRDTYEAVQQWLIEEVSIECFERWLRMALDLGQVGRLPMAAFDRLNKPVFIPRTWRWVDPLKEVAASEKELQLRITSRTRLCAERGIDFEQLVTEIAQEEALLRKAKVNFSLGASAPAAAPGRPGASEGGGQADAADGDDTETDDEEDENA